MKINVEKLYYLRGVIIKNNISNFSLNKTFFKESIIRII
jgi:hypothetical protein